MKKKILYIFGIFILAILFVSPFLYGIFVKNTDNLPTLTAIAEMSEVEVNSLLPGYKLNQLKSVWGEPDTREDNEVTWEIGDLTLIVNYKNNGVVAICGLKNDSGASVEE